MLIRSSLHIQDRELASLAWGLCFSSQPSWRIPQKPPSAGFLGGYLRPPGSLRSSALSRAPDRFPPEASFARFVRVPISDASWQTHPRSSLNRLSGGGAGGFPRKEGQTDVANPDQRRRHTKAIFVTHKQECQG
jgi:hypothetical protein